MPARGFAAMQPAGAEPNQAVKNAVGQERDAGPQTRSPDDDAVKRGRLASATQKRKRVLRACDECRREKIGCDGKLPCVHCKVYGYECTYHQPSNRGRNSGRYIEELETRLRKMEALLRITAPNLDLNDPLLYTSSPEQIETASRRAISRDHEVNKPAAETLPEENRRAAEDADESLLETMMENLGSLDIDDRGHWDYRGHSSSVIFLQRLHNQFGRLIDPSRSASRAWPMAHIREGPTLQFGSRQSLGYTTNRHPTADLPSKECARILCRGGLKHTCTLLRFVHEPSFWAMFDRIYAMPWEQMSSDEQIFLPLLYIVLGVGCCVADDADTTLGIEDFDDIVARGFQYFRACRRLIDITDCRDLTTLQAICFMILFLQTSAKLSICYSYIGLAQRAALRLGLHRSVTANFTPIEREIRKRIFWVVRSMDVYVSAICGLPLTVNDDDIDQEYPLEIDDECITPTGILAMPPGRTSLIVGANAHARLMDIMVKVLKYIYPVRLASDQARSGRTYMVSDSKIREIEQELDAWTAALPPPLQQARKVSSELERMRAQLNIVHAYVQWILYRPFLHSVSNGFGPQAVNGRSHACASACLNAARRIIHTVADMFKKRLINGSYWFAMHATYVSVLTLVFFVLENPDSESAGDGVVSDAFEGKDILAALAKDSVALKRCACLYSLFKYLPGEVKDNLDARYQPGTLNSQIPLHPTADTEEQYSIPVLSSLEQPQPQGGHSAPQFDASRAWQELIPQMFPSSAQFHFPTRPVPASEAGNSNGTIPTASVQSARDLSPEFYPTTFNNNTAPNINVDYDSLLETSIPLPSASSYSQQNDMKSQAWVPAPQSSIAVNVQSTGAEVPPSNISSQEPSPSSHDTLSTDSASQMPTTRPDDIWINDIWMNDTNISGLSSLRTGLEMDIGLDNVFGHHLAPSNIDADTWGQWWDTGT